MKRTHKHKSVSVEPQDEAGIASLIGRMQQQLISLEKKIDALAARSPEGALPAGNYVKPFRKFDKPGRFDRGGRENSFRERSFTKAICGDCGKECEVPFRPTGGRPVYCKECFPRHKESVGTFNPRPERNPREGGFAKYRTFGKPPGRQGHRPGGRGKPGFRSRKGRG